MPAANSFSIRPSTTSSEPVRVLLVDDNEGMLARATAALTPGCVIVGRVQDGPAAIEVAGTVRPDVIVLDISMPGMSGFELACRLRDAGSTAALVYLTIHEDEEFINAAKATGGIGYVVKRRLTSDLMIAVREACARRPFVSVIR
jgi:DNA-binding NarL/FixJ family response regulator